MFENEVKQVQGLPLRFRKNDYDRIKDIKLVKSMTAVRAVCRVFGLVD